MDDDIEEEEMDDDIEEEEMDDDIEEEEVRLSVSPGCRPKGRLALACPNGLCSD